MLADNSFDTKPLLSHNVNKRSSMRGVVPCISYANLMYWHIMNTKFNRNFHALYKIITTLYIMSIINQLINSEHLNFLIH